MIRSFKHEKKNIRRYKIGDFYTNRNLDLHQFFQRIEKQVGIYKIYQIKMAPWENIFENINRSFQKYGQYKIKRIESSATQPGEENRKRNRKISNNIYTT